MVSLGPHRRGRGCHGGRGGYIAVQGSTLILQAWNEGFLDENRV